MSTKILIVDHDPRTHALIAPDLKRSGYEVLPARDAEAASRCLDTVLPALMLLDWNLPGVTGLAFLHRLRGTLKTQHLPVIMVTARAEMIDKVQGLSSGADDYVTKPFSPVELLARIRAVLRGHTGQTTNDLLEVCNLKLELASHRVSAAGQELHLGPTEFRLLQYMMSNTDRLHTRAQLLSSVWGDNVAVDERTVDVYIRRLRSVLQATGHDVLIQTVRQGGYRFTTRPSGMESRNETDAIVESNLQPH